MPSIRRGPWKLILASDPKSNAQLQLYNLDSDLAETMNVAAEKSALVAELRELLETTIVRGRSTPGPVQKNDVRVRRYPLAAAQAKK